MPNTSIDALIRDLKGFNDRKTVVKEMRKEMRKPLPKVRKAIRKRALSTLPKSGGLAKLTSKTRIGATIRVNSRTLRVQMTGGRNSATGARADTRRLDQGKVRHPSWGRRGKGQWHAQTVTAGFFTDPATEVDQWRDACLKAVDRALLTLAGR